MRLTLMASLALALSGACSGNANPVRADPCRLISKAEMAAAVGAPVEPGRQRQAIRPEPGLAMCGYPTSTRFGEIVIAVQRPGRDGFDRSRARAKRTSTVPAYHPLEGLGDEAFAAGGGVSVLEGDTFLAVFAQYSFPDFQPIAQRLAERATS